ncbi:choice-of-anchor L domain-containing protein [Chryseobacterium tructae]|uniref:Choice-of-anchor L domain-containing protein n=1 Tax=Chryseobacterium tructae TaxID=1037380 RepID=A0ABV7Y1Q0_9FLAO|nr:choice-of-anchor L domain-containing protein [Chryseobacterium tructae]MDN3693719.1 choice-of-anchor L domain-containing protein [Chryseobacterium tructae]
MNRFYLFYIFFLVLPTYGKAQAVPVISNTGTPGFIAASGWSDSQLLNLLFGKDISSRVSNLKVWGKNTSIYGMHDLSKIGKVYPSAPDFADFDKALLFSTGRTFSLADNTSAGFTNNPGSGINGIDPFVNKTYFDKAGISFTYNAPSAGTFSGKVVFGSEEYLEYVGLANDVSRIIVNGNNILLTPDGREVSVDNINNIENSNLFVNNDWNMSGVRAYYAEPDGISKTLTFNSNLHAGLNTITIYVEDIYDNIYDSWLFFKAGSFKAPDECTQPPLLTGKSTIPSMIGITSHTTRNPGWQENISNGFIALESPDKGFVISRVNNDTSISDPREGMLIYSIADKCVKLYNGTHWNCIEQSCNQ